MLSLHNSLSLVHINTMKFFIKALQIAPALVFFIAFRVYGTIIEATTALLVSVIITSSIIALCGRFTRLNALVLLAALAFCLPTILLENENIIKLKPTFINYSLATLLLVSTFVFKKNILNLFMYKNRFIDAPTLDKLAFMWAMLWYFSGSLNLFLAFGLGYTFNISQDLADEIWVTGRTFLPPVVNSSFLLFTIVFVLRQRRKNAVLNKAI
ncbi:Intracellular septation protein [Anaerobiospirillum thomasii]|uniref:septation protein IspZ n=1 Tax=Anaerobiospirillum thomasii TaxID=179995 RepID=UPI000D84F1C0|nr:septation protein IspZ [Anaerobiospirillum thomasii]SPT67893.1 Intracellular septation protein [Anaerobiospirillum thomasii]